MPGSLPIPLKGYCLFHHQGLVLMILSSISIITFGGFPLSYPCTRERLSKVCQVPCHHPLQYPLAPLLQAGHPLISLCDQHELKINQDLDNFKYPYHSTPGVIPPNPLDPEVLALHDMLHDTSLLQPLPSRVPNQSLFVIVFHHTGHEHFYS